MQNINYHLPLMARTGQVQHTASLQDGFVPVKEFASREGVVELARSRRSGKLRIVKSVEHKDFTTPPNEARILSKLEKIHPNVVRLFAAEFNPRGGFALMCFEYCQGGDLHEQIQKFNRLETFIPPVFALHICVSIAEAISFIHHGITYSNLKQAYEKTCTNGIIHRDIKPDNVYLRFPGSTPGLPDVVLADFGLSCYPANATPGSGCTPFMSPECRFCLVSRLNHKTDVYSFGVMMHSILSKDDGYWPVYTDPKNVSINRLYAGLGFTDLLRSCLVVKTRDRGDFSGFHGSGMLSKILKLREERDLSIRSGCKVSDKYWVNSTV